MNNPSPFSPRVIARNEAISANANQCNGFYYLFSIMVFQRGGCVYIMTNKFNKVLYVGVTSNILGRVYDHKNKTYPDSFTARYNCDKLVYYMFYPHIEEAIGVEKAIKGGNRKSKVALVNSINPDWKDLYDYILE